jgi:prophage antirepressor-like protein
MWAVDHPEHGELLMAKHVLAALGYAVHADAGPAAAIRGLGIPKTECVSILRTALDARSVRANVTNAKGSPFPNRGGTFLTRRGVDLLLMSSHKPAAQAFREWLSDVRLAVENTGGYLLNEAARDTAFADTRTTVPLPAAIAGGYEALIEALATDVA